MAERGEEMSPREGVCGSEKLEWSVGLGQRQIQDHARIRLHVKYRAKPVEYSEYSYISITIKPISVSMSMYCVSLLIYS